MIGPGMMISDRYEIIDKVGSGGMADVYKAKDHRLNRFVAIKVLRQEYSSDAKFVAKFRAEAQSVAGLSHPNIVNVYDVDDILGDHGDADAEQGLYDMEAVAETGSFPVNQPVYRVADMPGGQKQAQHNTHGNDDTVPGNRKITDGKSCFT